MRGGSPTTSSLERDASEYPALYPFGVEVVAFLSAEDEVDAPFEARLRSVWRYVVGRIRRFAATLTPRESAVLDVEDIIHSVVAQLIEKDPYWDPDRGKYSTFVENIILNVLSTCHEQARAVSGPANSFARLKDYHARRNQGTLTRSMSDTMRAIERVMQDFSSVATSLEPPDPAAEPVEIPTILHALRSLEDPIQVWALVNRYGLFGSSPLTFRQIADILQIRRGQAKDLVEGAKAGLEAAIREIEARHEVV
jgi:DNA-directed RNA polymerase specialized sigma24 family protein